MKKSELTEKPTNEKTLANPEASTMSANLNWYSKFKDTKDESRKTITAASDGIPEFLDALQEMIKAERWSTK